MRWKNLVSLSRISTPSTLIQCLISTYQHRGITRTFTVTLINPLSSSSDSYSVSSSKNKIGSRSMSNPRSTRRSVSVHGGGCPSTCPSTCPSESTLTDPRYGVVNVQSYASVSSSSFHASPPSPPPPPPPPPPPSLFLVFEALGISSPNLALWPLSHAAASATLSGGRSSWSHSRNASSALKCSLTPVDSCVSSSALP